MHRSVGRFAGLAIRRANQLTRSHATAREKHKRNWWPVVASTINVNLWSAAEFTAHQDGDVLVKTTVVQVLDKRSEPQIERR